MLIPYTELNVLKSTLMRVKRLPKNQLRSKNNKKRLNCHALMRLRTHDSSVARDQMSKSVISNGTRQTGKTMTFTTMSIAVWNALNAKTKPAWTKQGINYV